MLQEKCKKEILSVCNFLKSQQNIYDVTVNNNNNEVVFEIDGDDVEENNDLKVVESIFSSYFKDRYKTQLSFNFGEKWELEVKGTKKLADGQSDKDITNKIITYNTDKNDWRLFRYITHPSPNIDDNYFHPSERIALMETSNLDKIFVNAAQDMASKKFVRNIIELNVNCLNESSLRAKYIFAFRQLPKQLKNRFVTSLVRIENTIALHELIQAVSVCKLCTENVLLTMSYEALLPKKLITQVRGIAGYIVTVKANAFETVNDLQKVYQNVTQLLGTTNIFLILEGNKVSEHVFANRNIKHLHESEHIILENDG